MTIKHTQPGVSALRAYELALTGLGPEEAWEATLRERYSAAKLKNQLRHTCPKWAFAALCHDGAVRGIASGGCPAAEQSRSAAFTLEALRHLRTAPSLAADKESLKRRVFGSPRDEGFRKPNDEVEVLLALWREGLIEKEV